MKDAYDDQIEMLGTSNRSIWHDWFTGRGLFKTIGDESDFDRNKGCLTQIRSRTLQRNAVINHKIDYELTDAIRKDTRIPEDPSAITLADLPAFAEWQRKIDKIIKQCSK